MKKERIKEKKHHKIKLWREGTKTCISLGSCEESMVLEDAVT